MPSAPRSSRSRARAPRLAAAWVALGLVLSACGGGGSDAAPPGDPGAATEPAGLLVVATTSILGDIAERLVADEGTVEVIMPPGADPHGFQPSAADAATLREADLVLANGLQLEESLLSALAAAEEEGIRIFELADQLDPIGFGEAASPAEDGHGHEDDDGHGHDDDGDGDGGHDDDGHDDDGHDHGPEDPHVWFDPVRMADGVRLIAAELATVGDHLDEAEWERRGEDYAEQVLAVHEELEALFAEIPDDARKLVTNHDSLGYLAHRYGFEVIGTVIPGSSTQAEADARRFSELIQAVESAGVPAIFAENVDAAGLAEQLASEIRGRGGAEVEVVELYTDALGEPGSGAETYLDLLRTTARRIAAALG